MVVVEYNRVDMEVGVFEIDCEIKVLFGVRMCDFGECLRFLW